MILNVYDMLPAKEQKKMIRETKNILINQFQSMDEKIIKVLMSKTSQRKELLEMVRFVDEYEIDQLLDEAMFNVSPKEVGSEAKGEKRMAKVRKCISIDKDVVRYINKISADKNISFSYIVNYYSKEFIKYHKEALANGSS